MRVENDEFRSLIRTGWIVIIFGLGGIVAWASFATLQSAAMAGGVVETMSGVIPVQHLGGGVVEKVHVNNGDRVKPGDVLISLDETQSRVQFDRIRQKYVTAQLVRHRLELEINDTDWEDPLELSNTDNAELIAAEKQLFYARLESHNVQFDILDRRINELREEIIGLKDEKRAIQKQIAIVNEQLSDVRKLAKKNLVPKTERLRMEGNLAELEGDIGRIRASISRAEQKIGESELRKQRLDSDRIKLLSGELNQNQETLGDLTERLKAAENLLDRSAITAEVPGLVTELAIKYKGQVIKSGDIMMKIVPSDQQLIITAKIAPNDIDVVKPGLEVEIRLTAYSTRSTKPISGTVTFVSPDRQLTALNEPYYEATVAIDPDSLEAAGLEDLVPGMMAHLSIRTGERSVWEYLLSPVLDSMDRSMREQ